MLGSSLASSLEEEMAGLKALIPLDGTKLSEHAFELLPLLKHVRLGEQL